MLKLRQVGAMEVDMKIIFSSDAISENDEKIILINIVGILEAIKNDKLLIDEAEKFLFSPYMVGKLRIKKCNESIIDILERGCELEDIVSLIPNKLSKTIDELENMALGLMKNYENFDKTFWIEK